MSIEFNNNKTVERIYGELKELEENFDIESRDEALIRNVFVRNLIDPKTQKELLKRVEFRKLRKLAKNIELSMKNRQPIQAHNRFLVPTNVNVVQNPAITNGRLAKLLAIITRQMIVRIRLQQWR